MSAMSFHWLDLAGRNYVVTGAASGIGLAVAESLVRVGAHVALVDRDGAGAERAAQQLRAQGARAIAVECDIASEQGVSRAGERVRRELGKVSGLVNNAGLLRAGALDEVSIADWNAVLAVNLTGYLLCSREFGRDMLEQGHGSLVHIASISALHPQTRSGAYSASKAGVLLMNKQLAAEWGPRGVRSNAVCPGMIRTALSASFYEVPGFEQARAAVTASRRVGEPMDIAQPTLFLLSDRAGYVNGTELVVDGGLDCMLMDMVPRPGFNSTAGSASQENKHETTRV
jgi:NAD(P)-dependent dehydrogenase (short-subunit alcohol dehydrogenase family)